MDLSPYHMFMKMGISEDHLISVYSHMKGLRNIPMRVEERIIIFITLGKINSKGEVTISKDEEG